MAKYKKPKYYLDDKTGEFVIEEYNFSKPLANFFPGIAAKFGIPMWVFYVNRAQGIISFGTKDKDHAILEFLPANKAWQLVSSQGFRTFIRTTEGKKSSFYEPFHNGFSNLGFSLSNKMRITSYDLKLEEENFSLGLKIKVEYFNIPNDSYAGLARVVTIKNTSRKDRDIQLLDGLPQIIPYGTANLFLKKLSRTIEAWMKVKNLENGVPFYKLDVDPTDRPEVIPIKGGNFYLSFFHEQQKPVIITPVINPEYIFGQNMDFSCPQNFISAKKFLLPKEQIISSKTPCGFSLLNLRLPAAGEKTLYCLIGSMRSLDMLKASIPKISHPAYLAQKRQENKEVIEELQADIETKSSLREFDLYAKQTYLDNIMRGGYPLVLRSQPADSVFYLYSRKHGDLERDYNKFQLQPTYFSQGNGNYRDANQNHRSDIWFNPEIKDENVIAFYNLLQTDGYNPLVVKGASFTLADAQGLQNALASITGEQNITQIISFLSNPFTPGEAILFIEDKKIKIKSSYDEFLNILLSHSYKAQEAEHAEGFWTDHWIYNLDLLESYLSVYPEKLKEIVFDKKAFTFFDNSEIVKPRNEKYILLEGTVRQSHAVLPDNAKRELIKKRDTQTHVVRKNFGKGEIYQTSLIAKMLCLFVNKMASLDPFGCGIEMEANKPNWYDALNGLPGLLGSSLCETFELKRLAIFIKEALEKTKVEKIHLAEEVYEFLIKLDDLVKENFDSKSGGNDFAYWDKSCALKEDYRHRTRLGLSGNDVDLSTRQLTDILNNALKKLDAGIAKARQENLYYSYFINEVTEYEPLKEQFAQPRPNAHSSPPLQVGHSGCGVKAKKFRQVRLPLFLGGQMHALRLSGSTQEARKIYEATKASAIFDKKLKMYKITACLKDAPQEIGRCHEFPSGWLEHESIWLHMEYKYLLELLKAGLYREFYSDFKNALIPFQPPERYGRSILENSSFLVGSAFADKNLHGNGFVARLSGSTAEFIQMWLMMNLGAQPFLLDSNGKLSFCLRPALAGWLFDRKGMYSFKLMSKIDLAYHNPKRKDTFGKDGVKVQRIVLRDKDNSAVEIKNNTIPSPYAQQVRARLISRIDAYLE